MILFWKKKFMLIVVQTWCQLIMNFTVQNEWRPLFADRVIFQPQEIPYPLSR